MNNENKKKSNLKIIIGIIIILCIALVAIFIFYNKNNQESVPVVTLGKIELVCVNENNEPVIGEKFALKDAEGKSLGEVESGTDGKVMFYSVPIGEYKLEVIQDVDGYKAEETVKSVTVVGGEKTTVTFKINWQSGNTK